jgi:AcrR family transcriptional regulator
MTSIDATRGRRGRSTGEPRGRYARSRLTRLRILDAARVEAEQEGLQHASVARIAARADVAVGVLNYHFGSKQELLRELMARQIEDFLARLSPPAEEEGFFAWEERLLVTYLEFLEANPTYVRLGEEIRLHDPDLYQQGIDAHIGQLCDRLKRGIELGEVRPLEGGELLAQAYFMLGAYNFLDRYLADPAWPGPAAAATALTDNLRRVLATPSNQGDPSR